MKGVTAIVGLWLPRQADLRQAGFRRATASLRRQRPGPAAPDPGADQQRGRQQAEEDHRTRERNGTARNRAANLISMVILQTEVKDRGIIILFIIPGFVDTQMLKDSAPRISAEKSAGLVIDRIGVLDASAAARLINYDGTVIHW